MNKFLLLAIFLFATRLTAQSCFMPDCPATDSYCNTDPNSPLFWNETYWSAPNGGTDLNEAPVPMTLPVVTSCPATTVYFRYLLFLDLDDDGVRETVIDSEALPGFNTVNFGNADNPNYAGGSPRAFDERPVVASQQYGFALEVTYVSLTEVWGSLRWNTQAAPNTYAIPQLPPGRHKIKWFIVSNSGEQKTCEYEFQVKKDCVKPTVVCLSNLAVNIMPTTFVTLWASDFLQYTEDNVTPANQIELGLRRIDTGTGFPEDSLGNPLASITYSCFDLGFQAVELWARDLAGNTEYCETYVTIEDNLGFCSGIIGTKAPNASFRTSVANPFSDRLRIDLHAERPRTLSIRLIDPNGREMLRRQEKIGAGDQIIELPAAHLPNGVYFLSITDETGTEQGKSLIKTSF